MTPVLLDTCALIWWTSDVDKLSGKALEACSKMKIHGAVISSISIWEIGMKIKNRKIDMVINFSVWKNLYLEMPLDLLHYLLRSESELVRKHFERC